jgi:hypothetical protein
VRLLQSEVSGCTAQCVACWCEGVWDAERWDATPGVRGSVSMIEN